MSEDVGKSRRASGKVEGCRGRSRGVAGRPERSEGRLGERLGAGMYRESNWVRYLASRAGVSWDSSSATG